MPAMTDNGLYQEGRGPREDADLAEQAALTLRIAASLLRDQHPSMTISGVLLLSHVALDSGQSVSTYSKNTGIPIQTASRALKDLAEGTRSRVRAEGPRLIEGTEGGGINGREVTYRLTAKGRELLRTISIRVRRVAPGNLPN